MLCFGASMLMTSIPCWCGYVDAFVCRQIIHFFQMLSTHLLKSNKISHQADRCGISRCWLNRTQAQVFPASMGRETSHAGSWDAGDQHTSTIMGCWWPASSVTSPARTSFIMLVHQLNQQQISTNQHMPAWKSCWSMLFLFFFQQGKSCSWGQRLNHTVPRQ